MEKINIAEILKDCPKGTKLYSPLCGECYFDRLNMGTIICKKQNTQEIAFTSKGYYMLPVFDGCECLLFPSKENRDWSKFQKPFKDGEIISNGNCICIYNGNEDDNYYGLYVGIGHIDFPNYFINIPQNSYFTKENARLATEEEKQKLFDAIKENEHRWNSETKTLEKLVKPKFKVGDVIQDIDAYRVTITEVNLEDECYEYESTFAKGIGSIMFSNQDEWKLVPVIKPKFKVGDNITKIDGSRKGEIFYIDIDRYHVAVSSNIGIDVFFEDQDDWKLIPNKFNITTLKPFESRVLVRDYVDRMWRPAFWGKHIEDSNCRYLTTNGCWMQCIPYEGNEHLLGTTNDCDECFKNWK